MSLELRNHESLRQGVRRIARQQLQMALGRCAEAAGGNVDESVHELRKSLKRVRAMLRLVRFAIGEYAYRSENESLRDIGRPLSAMRDSKVLGEALARLQASAPDVNDAVFAPARAVLANRRRRIDSDAIAAQGALQAAEEELGAALARVDGWARLPRKWRAVGEGARRVYRQGRRAYDRAHDEPTVRNLHEWRKHVKYLRHQLEALAPMWPKALSPLAKQAEELGELLGEDHDLAVLGEVLSGDDARGLTGEAADAIYSSIANRREELLNEILMRGECLYREKPKEFEARLKRSWKRWNARRKRACRQGAQPGGGRVE